MRSPPAGRGLCTPAEQLVWQWVAVFRHPVTQRMLVDVFGGIGHELGMERAEIVKAVAGLRDKSILSTVPDTDVSARMPRLVMLDTLRQYGAEKLAGSGQRAAVHAAHVTYYRNLAAEAAANWLGPDELTRLDTIDRQRPHLAVALDHCVASGDLTAARLLVVDLVRSRSPFLRGWLGEARAAAERVVRAGGGPTSLTRRGDGFGCCSRR